MDPKSGKNPKRNMAAARAASRCGARTRSGLPCCAPAMANSKCRMHGGTSTGPRTAEGLERIRAARTIHGGYGAEMAEFRECVRVVKARARKLVEAV